MDQFGDDEPQRSGQRVIGPTPRPASPLDSPEVTSEQVRPSATAPEVPARSTTSTSEIPARRRGLRPLRSLDYLGRDLIALRRPRDRNLRRRLQPLIRDGYLFVHVPKTAGTSVSAGFYGPDLFVGHTTARQARRAIGPWAYSRLFTFAFVREPVSRLNSTFRYLQAGGAQNTYDLKWQEALARYPTLERLVVDERMLASLMDGQLHFRPQHRYLCDPAGRLLVREVGRFERLADDVERIAAGAGVQVELPRLNSSDTEAEVPLGRTALERVRDLYARDRELFGYV